MVLNRWMLGLSAGLLVSMQVNAASPMKEQLQVTQCLADKLSIQYPVLAENNQFRIIEVPTDAINSIAKQADKLNCGRFVNVTHQLDGTDKPQQAKQLLQKKPVKAQMKQNQFVLRHSLQVADALKQVKSENIASTLEHLTSYKNRSATQNTGVQTAKWLKKTFEAYATEYGVTDTETYFVKTGSYYKQPSLVTVINKNSKQPALVLGAHMDTLDGLMPGAGDDGSGSSSLMEAARDIMASKLPLNRPVYFIWYSAEERGLVGSQYVVAYFQKKKIPVLAVLQLDMTGFRNDPNDPTMWVFRDYTNDDLSEFVKLLITNYIEVPVQESECGYGCSDHASWDAIGIPAAFPCETDFEHHNTKIHTSGDTMDRLSLDHMKNFAKLGIAFVLELALDL